MRTLTIMEFSSNRPLALRCTVLVSPLPVYPSYHSCPHYQLLKHMSTHMSPLFPQIGFSLFRSLTCNKCGDLKLIFVKYKKLFSFTFKYFNLSNIHNCTIFLDGMPRHCWLHLFLSQVTHSAPASLE